MQNLDLTKKTIQFALPYTTHKCLFSLLHLAQLPCAVRAKERQTHVWLWFSWAFSSVWLTQMQTSSATSFSRREGLSLQQPLVVCFNLNTFVYFNTFIIHAVCPLRTISDAVWGMGVGWRDNFLLWMKTEMYVVDLIWSLSKAGLCNETGTDLCGEASTGQCHETSTGLCSEVSTGLCHETSTGLCNEASTGLCCEASTGVCAVKPVQVCAVKPVQVCAIKHIQVCAMKPIQDCAVELMQVCPMKPVQVCVMKPVQVCAKKPVQVCAMMLAQACAKKPVQWSQSDLITCPC